MVKQGKRYTGLARQLIGIIIAIRTLFTVIVTGLSPYVEYQDRVSYLSTQIDQVKTGHLPGLTSSLWVEDRDQLQVQAESVFQLPTVSYLLIEDDKFLRELIIQKLGKEGFEVVEAPEGEGGLVKMKEEKPDLVLLDLILPGIDGFEVLHRAKEDAELKGIPVIILSNLGQKDDVQKGVDLGAVDYLIKAHFTPGEIVEKIKVTLAQKTAQP